MARLLASVLPLALACVGACADSPGAGPPIVYELSRETFAFELADAEPREFVVSVEATATREATLDDAELRAYGEIGSNDPFVVEFRLIPPAAEDESSIVDAPKENDTNFLSAPWTTHAPFLEVWCLQLTALEQESSVTGSVYMRFRWLSNDGDADVDVQVTLADQACG